MCPLSVFAFYAFFLVRGNFSDFGLFLGRCGAAVWRNESEGTLVCADVQPVEAKFDPAGTGEAQNCPANE